MGGKAMIKLWNRILRSLPIVVLTGGLLPALAQAQFTQQGAKMVGTGAVGAAAQGISVALSGDGNTAIVGGSSDDSVVGAAWVYTRSGGVWSQQAKLVGTGAVGYALQGSSVSLSGDGNTAIVGGFVDDSSAAAAACAPSARVCAPPRATLVCRGAVGTPQHVISGP